MTLEGVASGMSGTTDTDLHCGATAKSHKFQYTEAEGSR